MTGFEAADTLPFGPTRLTTYVVEPAPEYVLKIPNEPLSPTGLEVGVDPGDARGVTRGFVGDGFGGEGDARCDCDVELPPQAVNVNPIATAAATILILNFNDSFARRVTDRVPSNSKQGTDPHPKGSRPNGYGVSGRPRCCPFFIYWRLRTN